MGDHPVLRSARLVLRPLREADKAVLTAIRGLPEVSRWWGPVGDTDFDADDDLVLLSIVINGEVAGLIQYDEEQDPMYRSAGIDMFLHPSQHGRGYGREAIRLVAHHLLDTLGHHRLTIDPSAANIAAIRSYTAVGFRPVGVLRQYERNIDESGWHDGLLMDLIVGELVD